MHSTVRRQKSHINISTCEETMLFFTIFIPTIGGFDPRIAEEQHVCVEENHLLGHFKCFKHQVVLEISKKPKCLKTIRKINEQIKIHVAWLQFILQKKQNIIRAKLTPCAKLDAGISIELL